MIEYLVSSERSNNTMKVISHVCRGNTFWAVWKHKESGKTWIECTLIRKFYAGEYGYKDTEESMHPNRYDCPLSYLEKANDGIHQEWRDRVKAHWANIKAIRALKPGQQLLLKSCSIPHVTIISTRPLRGSYNGVVYRVKFRHIAPLVSYQESVIETTS